MATPELTDEQIAEDVMNNDTDPMDAIRAIRREEGVAEEDLPPAESEVLEDVVDETPEPDDETEQDEPEPKGEPVDEAEPAEDEDPEAEEPQKEDEVDTKSRTFKANGQEFTFTEEEIYNHFETVFGQSMNYTQKMQKIAPYRKMISALEQEGVTHDSLNLALDALKGDKGALKQMLENAKIDAYDLTSEDEDSPAYVPGNYGKDETALDIEEITSKLQGDEEFKITKSVIDDQWDDNSRRAFADNPNMITGLHNDIVSGMYDTVAPRAMKMKVLDGNTKSDIEYYMLAGQQVAQEFEAAQKLKDGKNEVDELNADAQGADSKFDKASSEADRKRAASSTGKRADRKGVIDYLDDDDEAYEEWYKNLHASL